jgi:hypothetical protein
VKSSAGVTSAAIIALLGSACVAFFGVSSLFGMLFAFQHGEPEGAFTHQAVVPLMAAMIMESLLNFGLAGWGFATGIGLLRLKAWSRISALIFAGLLAAITPFIAVGLLIGRWAASSGSLQRFNFFFGVMMASFCAVLLTIAVWWLVLFTRKSVIEQFSGTAPVEAIPGASASGELPVFAAATPLPRRPLAITVIAWFYLASLPSMIPAFLMYQYQKMPIPFFGRLLGSRGAVLYFALSVSVLLAAGIALLKNRVWGFWLAFSNELFRLLNFAATVFLPGSAKRWEKVMASIQIQYSPEMPHPPLTFPPAFLWIGFGAGFLVGLAILSILWTCRKRFFELAAMQARPAPNA